MQVDGSVSTGELEHPMMWRRSILEDINEQRTEERELKVWKQQKKVKDTEESEQWSARSTGGASRIVRSRILFTKMMKT